MAIDTTRYSLGNVFRKARDLFSDTARGFSRTTGTTDLLSGSAQALNNDVRSIGNRVVGMATNNPQRISLANQQQALARQGSNRAFGSSFNNGSFKFTGTGAPRVAVTAAGTLFPGAKAASVVGGAFGGVGAALTGQNVAEGVGAGAGMGLQSNAVAGATNPLLKRLVPRANTVLASRVIPSALNVAQGVLVDRTLGFDTTPGSVALDAAVGLLGGRGQFDAPRVKTKATAQPVQRTDLIYQPPNENNLMGGWYRPAKSRLISVTPVQGRRPDGTYDFITKVPKMVGDEVGGKKIRFRVDPKNPNRLIRVTKKGDAAGLIAGFEPEYDENGKLIGVTYNPTTGVLGVAGMAVGKRLQTAGTGKAAQTAPEISGQQGLLAAQTMQGAEGTLPRLSSAEGQVPRNSQLDTNTNQALLDNTPNTLKVDSSQGSQSQKITAGQTITNSLESPRQTPTELLAPQKASGLSGEMDTALAEKSSIKDQTQLETKQVALSNTSKPYFNTKNYKLDKASKKVIDEAIEEVKPAIEKVVGKKLTNKEVVKKANVTAKILNKAVTRDQTEAWEAALLKTRQKLAALSESGTVDKEYLDTLVTIKSLGTDIARKLQSFSIGADPQMVTSKQAILEAVTKVEKDTDKVLQAAQGVDFNNFAEATAFYRKFVQPTLEEKLDLLRYNSMLSSPNTHINNFFSNYQGTGLIAPLEKTVAGGIDALRAVFNDRPRTRFAGEGVAYAKGYYSSLNKAFTAFTDVLKGKSLSQAPDTRSIPLYTKGTGKAVENVLGYPMKLLEASDQFFTALTKAGSESALNYRLDKGQAKGMNVEALANEEAAQRLFRSELGENNGSLALNALDIVANKVQSLKGSDNPIVRTIAKYSLPFLRTPTNILKQAVEYTPFGVVTLPGSVDKTGQIAKWVVGSSIGVGIASLVGGDRLTWSEPAGEKQKQAFRAAGLQPYSVKIGDKWVSYSKLHPAISFNFALVAAIRNAEENKTLDDGQIETLLQGAMKWVNFFADQSYMKNIGDIVSASKGDVEGFARLPSNYTQQLIPFRALMGWAARLVDPYQRRVDPDGSLLEKQLGYLATQIPGFSNTVPARLDVMGNPIPNQNRVLNAFSPARVTTERSAEKNQYDLIKAKAKADKQNKQLNEQIKAGATDTGLSNAALYDKYMDLGLKDQITPEMIVEKYSKDLTLTPSGSKYQDAINEDKVWDALGRINSSESLSDGQKTQAIAQMLDKAGIDTQDYQYYQVAKQENDLKTMYAIEELTKVMTAPGSTKESVLEWLKANRYEFRGKMVLSSGVIDNLVDEGLISYDEGKALKKYTFDKDKTTGQYIVKSGKKKGGTRVRAPKPKRIKLKTIKPPKVKVISSSGKKFKAPKIKAVDVRLRIKK